MVEEGPSLRSMVELALWKVLGLESETANDELGLFPPLLVAFRTGLVASSGRSSGVVSRGGVLFVPLP